MLFLLLSFGACSQAAPSAAGRLAFQPPSAAFEVPYGGEVSEDFRLIAATRGAPSFAAPASLTVQGAVDPDLRVEPLPAQPGLGPGLRIHAVGRRVGVRVGTLQVVPGPGPGHPVPLLYALRVHGTLTVLPTNPTIDLRAAEPAAALTVRSTQPGFLVTAVEIAAGPFAATFARDPDGTAYLVRVTAVATRFPAGARGAAGTLVIRSTDGVEPRREVPLFAFGRTP